jgi:hypothetical protein
MARQTPLQFTDVLPLLFLNSLILLHTAPILPNGYYFKCHTRRWGAFRHINKNPVKLDPTISADQQMFISLGKVAYSWYSCGSGLLQLDLHASIDYSRYLWNGLGASSAQRLQMRSAAYLRLLQGTIRGTGKEGMGVVTQQQTG